MCQATSLLAHRVNNVDTSIAGLCLGPLGSSSSNLMSIPSAESGGEAENWWSLSRKVDIRLPGKGNSNSHGARPVHLIITMIKWIRTGRLSKKNSLSGGPSRGTNSRSPPPRGGGSREHRIFGTTVRVQGYLAHTKTPPTRNARSPPPKGAACSGGSRRGSSLGLWLRAWGLGFRAYGLWHRAYM